MNAEELDSQRALNGHRWTLKEVERNIDRTHAFLIFNDATAYWYQIRLERGQDTQRE